MEPASGLDPRTLKSWPELKSRVGCLIDWVGWECLILFLTESYIYVALKYKKLSFLWKAAAQLSGVMLERQFQKGQSWQGRQLFSLKRSWGGWSLEVHLIQPCAPLHFRDKDMEDDQRGRLTCLRWQNFSSLSRASPTSKTLFYPWGGSKMNKVWAPYSRRWQTNGGALNVL